MQRDKAGTFSVFPTSTIGVYIYIVGRDSEIAPTESCVVGGNSDSRLLSRPTILD